VRPPGRPRDARADEAIIEATLQALEQAGFAGLSMEAVAARAKVGKATLYRRWSTKESLVADALASLVETAEPVDTGSLRDDLVAWLNTVRRHNLQTVSGRIMPRLLAERDAHPELFETYRQRVIEPFRLQLVKVLARGIDTGQLAADIDIDLVTDLLVGPVIYRQLTSGNNEVTGTRVGQVVDIVLEGIMLRQAGDTAATPAATGAPSSVPAGDRPAAVTGPAATLATATPDPDADDSGATR
jgi:AcrR family transcriptional regulator